MEFNGLEKRMLRRIEKQVGGWKYTRWIIIVTSISFMVLYSLNGELFLVMAGSAGISYT